MTYKLLIEEDDVRRIREHGQEIYPHECCGALIGRDDGDGRVVTAIYALPNASDEAQERRFLVRPEDYRAADAWARRQRADVIGFYHSHPDHPARPSQHDLDHAWPWLSYVIVSVRNRGAAELLSWRLRDDRSAFDAEEVISNPAVAEFRS